MGDHVVNDPVPTMIIALEDESVLDIFGKSGDLLTKTWSDNMKSFKEAMEELSQKDAYKPQQYDKMHLKLALVYCKQSTSSGTCSDLIKKGEMPFLGFAKRGALHQYYGYGVTSPEHTQPYSVKQHLEANFLPACESVDKCTNKVMKNLMK